MQMILIVDQVYIFMYAIIGGAIAALFYDFLRIKRRAIKTNTIIVSLEDVIYWLAAAVFLFVTVYKSNSGEMRGYIVIGNIIGVFLYESLFSNIIIASSVMIINIIKRIILLIFKVISYPFIILYKVVKLIFKLLYRVSRFIFKPLFILVRIIKKKLHAILEKTISFISKQALKITKLFFDKIKGFSTKAGNLTDKKLKQIALLKKIKKDQKNN